MDPGSIVEDTGVDTILSTEGRMEGRETSIPLSTQLKWGYDEMLGVNQIFVPNEF